MTEILEQPPGEEGDDQEASEGTDPEIVTGVDFQDADELEGDEDTDDEPDA